jgi:hypothetical protein
VKENPAAACIWMLPLVEKKTLDFDAIKTCCKDS